ncbi:hypothetical protein FRAHR75_560036 [Frankia sp. Hr75.2]|nr:hypothetical protein FRAHR75_560036 [Frankia sp. Hr75.2]
MAGISHLIIATIRAVIVNVLRQASFANCHRDGTSGACRASECRPRRWFRGRPDGGAGHDEPDGGGRTALGADSRQAWGRIEVSPGQDRGRFEAGSRPARGGLSLGAASGR